MHDERSPLLAQVPLTVSPFLHLPKPPTLPHNYTSLPSTLPPSILSSSSSSDKPAYITTPSGHSAHPSQISNQNASLLQTLHTSPSEAERKIREWEERIRERDLAEKRRRAPGWLDREEKMLVPARPAESTTGAGSRSDATIGAEGTAEQSSIKPKVDLLGDDEAEVEGDRGADLGAAMDKAFGGLG
ncbi:hypothetical protein MBLNU457_g0890t1 [Dothideomycetes sp. NU457]